MPPSLPDRVLDSATPNRRGGWCRSGHLRGLKPIRNLDEDWLVAKAFQQPAPVVIIDVERGSDEAMEAVKEALIDTERRINQVVTKEVAQLKDW